VGERSAASASAILLDAAMGTRLITRGLDLARDDPALWNLTHPEAVLEVHRGHVAAGSRVILTNTFGANRAWLARFGRSQDLVTINAAACSLARQAGPSCAVWGSIGPTASLDVAAFNEQATALLEAGVDALLLETHSSERVVDGTLRVILAWTPAPTYVSLHDWPDTPVAAELAEQLVVWGAAGLGFNCTADWARLANWAAALERQLDIPLLAKPSGAGTSPGDFAREAARLVALGVGMIGGCCGTDERHLAALQSRLHTGSWNRESHE
jgi:methionine synthase I (cobalamin-dependent)